MTGSGKTAAFLLPILHRLIGTPRGTTRALVLTPTRELAAQILEAPRAQLAVHTPLTGAAVFGGVGMGPQEHAFRSGVDVIVATPGRLLDHFRVAVREAAAPRVSWCSTRPTGCSTWASCRTCAGSCSHLPARRQTLFFSATMPPPIVDAHEARCCANPATIQLRAEVGAGDRHHAGHLPGAAGAQVRAADGAAVAGRHPDALVFTRTKHRANRLAEYLVSAGHCRRTHSRQPLARRQRTAALAGLQVGQVPACWWPRTSRRAASTSTSLAHVVNFDVPARSRGLHPPRGSNGTRRGDR